MIPKTYAFIDMQNIHLGVKNLGWEINWKKLFIYLEKKHHTEKIFIFLGYIPSNERLYNKLRTIGCTLMLKEVVIGKDGKSKGNVDAELVLEVVDRITQYDKGILISGDGDFVCLLYYWRKHNKKFSILSPSPKTTSFLLRKHGRENLLYISRMKQFFE